MVRKFFDDSNNESDCINSKFKTQNCQRQPFNIQHSKLKNAKSAIERFYDEQGDETEMVVMKAGSNNNPICRHL